MGSPPAPDFEPHEFQFRSAADPSPGGPFSDSDAGPLAAGGGCGGGGGGARYKLLSPAKLPISRSACITIPPGLSPTSFLESPVLLSNVKVEPSPTTCSLIRPYMMNGLIGLNSDTRLANSGCPDSFDEGRSGIFEFKPLATSSLVLHNLSNSNMKLVCHNLGISMLRLVRYNLEISTLNSWHGIRAKFTVE